MTQKRVYIIRKNLFDGVLAMEQISFAPRLDCLAAGINSLV